MIKTIAAFLYICLSVSAFANLEAYNFGTVISNETYQIYRSATLGTKGIEEVWASLRIKNLPTPKTIVYLSEEGFKNRFSSKDLALQEYLAQDQYGIKMFHSFDYKERTYLDGNNPLNPTEDIDTKNNLSDDALKYFGPDPSDGIDGGVDALYRILDIILNPANQPVLFHCLNGKHRTGMVSMILKHLQSDSAQDIISTDALIKSRAEVEYKNFVGLFGVRAENIYFVRSFITSSEYQLYLKQYRGQLN